MNNHLLLTDDLLWDYADGFLDAVEKQRVDAYLNQHPEWRARLDLILEEKSALASIPLAKPQVGFSDRVMAAWAAEHVQTIAKDKGKDWIISAIALVFGLLVCVPFVVMVISVLLSAPVSAPAVTVPKEIFSDWDKVLGSPALQYALYLVLAVSLLRFLERFLQHRKLVSMYHKSHE